jgi:hypothetical protein
LEDDVKDWAQQLPPNLSAHYEQIFGEIGSDPDAKSMPARFRLQESLLTAGVVPAEKEWLDAFVEHWKIKRAELGDRGNAFAQLNESDAVKHLLELSRRIHRTCEADSELARRTILRKLDALLERHDADLALRQRAALIPYYARDLPTDVQALVLERPAAWEFLLFSAVLSHEISQHSSLRRDYIGGSTVGPALTFRNRAEVFQWLRAHIDSGAIFAERISHLVSYQLQTALGPPGTPGDPEAIVDVARKLGEVERSALEWVFVLRRVRNEPIFSALLQSSERLVEDMIRQLREFSERIAMSVREALSGDSPSSRQVSVTLTLTIPDGVADEIQRECGHLAKFFRENPTELR